MVRLPPAYAYSGEIRGAAIVMDPFADPGSSEQPKLEMAGIQLFCAGR